MPYVPVLPGKRPDLTETAERRWTVIAEGRPDLAPALELQRRLLTLVVDLDQTLRAGRLPRLSLPPKYLAAKVARGVPAFAGEPIPLPIPAMTPVLLRLCDALATGGAGDAAAHIHESIAAGQMDPGSLFAASLARNQSVIRTGAVHRGLAPDLVWLVAELAVSPFVHLLQQSLLEQHADDTLRAALQQWDGGYCPACGSWPAVAEVVGGHRTLRCSFCSSGWELTRYACIYCRETGAKFVTAAPNEERKDRRVEVCSNCGGYLKTIDLPELSPFPLLSISDIETTDLDIAAMEHGYARPALKEFGSRKG
jgi:formate dehydrogenase formation protein